MKEELISFETAKLAKEKGFPQDLDNLLKFYVKPNCKMFGLDEHYRAYSIQNSTKNKLYEIGKHSTLHFKNAYFTPTQSLLQKWLRENHNTDITVALVSNGYGCYIHKNRNYTNQGESYKSTFSYNYEKALEKGLQEALKLIENEQH